MEVIYRRRGEMVEICQELEYLTRILNEYEWFCRREEIKRDRMFDAVVSAGNARIKLISGDCNRIFFRFSIDD